MEQFYPIFCALAFNLLDLLTGIVSAIKAKEIKSSRLRDGLLGLFCATLLRGVLTPTDIS